MATAKQIAWRKKFAQLSRAGMLKRKKRASNPAAKKAARKSSKQRTVSVAQPSRATGKRPTSRSVARRKKTLRAPRSYCANPSLRTAALVGNRGLDRFKVSDVTATGKKLVARFTDKADAIAYAKARSNAFGCSVSVHE